MEVSLGVLEVFVSAGCRGCRRARELVAWARKINPSLKIRVVDISEEPTVGDRRVFAVPTYAYRDQILYLGNPSESDFRGWLDKLCSEV